MGVGRRGCSPPSGRMNMKQLVLTCDTEIGELAPVTEEAVELFVRGRVAGQDAGLNLINRLAAAHGATVFHFVDVYPCGVLGEQPYAQVCSEILEGGHELGLHTHPGFHFDGRRRFMNQYDLSEQIAIVEFGKGKILDWTGDEVICHRAGGYGADENTLRALGACGMRIDSSCYPQAARCRIDTECRNKPFMTQGIVEVPITVFEQKRRCPPWPVVRSGLQKLDFRYGASADEILAAIDLLPGGAVVVLFMHSFNFLKLPYDFRARRFGHISVDADLIRNYEYLLGHLAARDDCRFVSLSDIDVSPAEEGRVPVVETDIPLAQVLRGKIRRKVFGCGFV